ncbi:MAG: GIY-YIG nuclease family protein [Eubacterium sp.]|nr:GIY-YIG nuclease family protein [Eubacterium sp.]
MSQKQFNFLRAKAIEQKNKERIKQLCAADINEDSGIYVFYREENGINYAYIGQAKHLLTRCAQHLSGYQHIDLSLKKHGLYDTKKNPNGWQLSIMWIDEEALDHWEQHYIKQYANAGYQLYNHTTGSQGEGKRSLGEAKSPKGYREGVKQGEKNVKKQIAHLFDLHLKAVPKADKPSKNAIKALDKFNQLIQGDSDE